MKYFAFLFLGVVAGCTEPVPAPTASTQPAAIPAEVSAPVVSVRSLSFVAQNNDSDIAANCDVRGTDFAVSFVTPAQIDVPIGADNRAAISSVTCTSGGVENTMPSIPGENTKVVVADFSSQRADFWLERSDRSVLYYVREGTLITVRGSPAP